jgi:hypothetical protein
MRNDSACLIYFQNGVCNFSPPGRLFSLGPARQPHDIDEYSHRLISGAYQ